MAGGLRYETGWDMPPGMAEKAAVKIARDMEAAVPVPKKYEEWEPDPELEFQRNRMIEIIMTVPPIGSCIRGRQQGKGLFTAKHFADFFVANGFRIPRWIPVAERKPDFELQMWRKEHPDEPLQVMVAIKDAREATILSYDEDGDFFAVDDYGDVETYNVTHWLALPAVPGVEK